MKIQLFGYQLSGILEIIESISALSGKKLEQVRLNNIDTSYYCDMFIGGRDVRFEALVPPVFYKRESQLKCQAEASVLVYCFSSSEDYTDSFKSDYLSFEELVKEQDLSKRVFHLMNIWNPEKRQKVYPTNIDYFNIYGVKMDYQLDIDEVGSNKIKNLENLLITLVNFCAPQIQEQTY